MNDYQIPIPPGIKPDDKLCHRLEEKHRIKFGLRLKFNGEKNDMLCYYAIPGQTPERSEIEKHLQKIYAELET